MIKKDMETRSVEVVKDLFCNKCGASCLKSAEHEQFEFATLQAHWGYWSDNRDGEVHEAHLCQNCWEELVKTFKHSDLISERF